MAFSESSATMHFYAQQLERLRKCEFPRQLSWTKPTSMGELSVRVVSFQGQKFWDELHQYNYYGDKQGTNVVFFFQLGTQYGNYRWSVTVHDRDEFKLPVEWSLDTPPEFRDGFPDDVERAMRELIEGLFTYAKECCDYKPEVSDEEVKAFFDGIAAKVAAARKNRR